MAIIKRGALFKGSVKSLVKNKSFFCVVKICLKGLEKSLKLEIRAFF